MTMQVNVGQCAMEQLNESLPNLLTLVGLAGLLTDSSESALMMSLGTSMELPVSGFHSRRYQSLRKDGHRGMRHARLV